MLYMVKLVRMGVSMLFGAQCCGPEVVRMSVFKQRTVVMRVEHKAESLPLRNLDRLHVSSLETALRMTDLLDQSLRLPK